jgi:hypothetical protein
MLQRRLQMRCQGCDCNLSDFESTRKHPGTGEYIDLCNTCHEEVQDVLLHTDKNLQIEFENDLKDAKRDDDWE